MLMDVAAAEILLENGHLPVSLVRPSGEILYENRTARQLLGHESDTAAGSVLSCLSVPASWEEILQKILKSKNVEDEAILLQTLHGDAELAYLTALPQYDADGQIGVLLCVWASHRKALTSSLTATNTGTLSEYARELEELLEHRTYQNLLSAEQNEFARDALDALSVGILIISHTGEILYRNRTMTDQYGWYPQNYVRLDAVHVLPADLKEAYDRCCQNGLRAYCRSLDPAGRPADVDLLPLLRAGKVLRVVFQYSRGGAGA
jgi:PAS domain-containing protein